MPTLTFSARRALFTAAILVSSPLAAIASPITVAHRGYSEHAPENTLAAINAAAGYATHVEWDILITSDDHLVLMHDLSVNRTTTGPHSGNVSSLTLAQIQALEAGSWFSPAFTGEPVPTNAQAVAAAQFHGLHPVIERKGNISANRLYSELTSLGIRYSSTIIAFETSFITAINALDPNLHTGALGGNAALNATAISNRKASGADFIGWSANNITSKSIVDAVHAEGMELWIYTVNSVDQYRRLESFGVDAIITDDPDLLTNDVRSIPTGSAIARVSKGAVAAVLNQSVGLNLHLPDPSNTGDLDLGFSVDAKHPNGYAMFQSEGVVMANINQLGVRAVVEVAGARTEPVNFPGGNATNGGTWLAISNQNGGAEGNYHVSMAYFPFEKKWVGGTINADASVEVAGNLPSGTTVTNPGGAAGRYQIKMPGINSQTDGMLFVVGAKNNDANVVGAAPLADGSGWNVAVRNYNQDLAAGESDAWNFVYVPYDADNLIGGRIASDASVLNSVGTFNVSSIAQGRYLIQIGNLTDSDGSLMVSVALEVPEVPGSTNLIVDDNFLSWGYDAALQGFIVESRDMPNGGLQNTGFVFAFMQYDNPLSLPEPTTLTALAMGGLMAIRRKR